MENISDKVLEPHIGVRTAVKIPAVGFSCAIISLSLRSVFGPLNCELRQTRTSKIMCILPRLGVWLQNLAVKKSRFAVREISDHPSVLRFPLRRQRQKPRSQIPHSHLGKDQKLVFPQDRLQPGVPARFGSFVSRRAAKSIGFGIQHRVQRHLNRVPDHFTQVILDPRLIDVNYFSHRIVVFLVHCRSSLSERNHRQMQMCERFYPLSGNTALKAFQAVPALPTQAAILPNFHDDLLFPLRRILLADKSSRAVRMRLFQAWENLNRAIREARHLRHGAYSEIIPIAGGDAL